MYFSIVVFCLYACRASLNIGVYTEWTPVEILWLQLQLQENGSDFLRLLHCKQMYVTHTHRSGYGNVTKIFKLSMARQVGWYIVFVNLKLSLLIAGPINPCKYFPVACVISQIIFFLQYACLCQLCRFSLRGSQIRIQAVAV